MIEFIQNNYATFLTTVTIITVILNIFNHWYIHKGQMNRVYLLSIFVYVGYIMVETAMALRHPEQWSIMLYNITNFWALSMAILGHRRLKQLQKTEAEAHPPVK